jgi:hypothetical protein
MSISRLVEFAARSPTINIYSHVLLSMNREAADKIESVFAVDPRKSRRNDQLADAC